MPTTATRRYTVLFVFQPRKKVSTFSPTLYYSIKTKQHQRHCRTSVLFASLFFYFFYPHPTIFDVERERAAFLFFRYAKRGDGIFDKCQKPEGRAKRCSIPRLNQRVLGRLKERSTPKRVDFNERRRIEPRPSICNFQSFYNRKPFVVSVSFSCGSLRLFRCFL